MKEKSKILRTQTKDALMEALEKKYIRMKEIRLLQGARKLKNIHEGLRVRREIARLLTLLREKQAEDGR
ncbi:MAG: hypothetical protein G01um101466_759 [Parcubacteria group bacterium Gr01-1014_66]|nr:MAG: hypothetical protein G01um101466_759 [Parcubacteria group bacterium Gr01-1014_66]